MRKEILWPSCPALTGFHACLGYNKPQLLELTSLWQKGLTNGTVSRKREWITNVLYCVLYREDMRGFSKSSCLESQVVGNQMLALRCQRV